MPSAAAVDGGEKSLRSRHFHLPSCNLMSRPQSALNNFRAPDAIKLKNRRLDITPAVAVMAKTEEDVMKVMEFVNQNNGKLDV